MRLGKEGWYKVLPYGPLTQAEKASLEGMLPTLRMKSVRVKIFFC
jgi:malate dehydrogenase